MFCVCPKSTFIRTCERVYIYVSTDHFSVVKVKAVFSPWDFICSLLFTAFFTKKSAHLYCVPEIYVFRDLLF